MKASAYRRQVPTYIPCTALGSQPYPHSHTSRAVSNAILQKAEMLTSGGRRLERADTLTSANRREATRKQQAVK
jgi:ribosomal protein L44E